MSFLRKIQEMVKRSIYKKNGLAEMPGQFFQHEVLVLSYSGIYMW